MTFGGLLYSYWAIYLANKSLRDPVGTGIGWLIVNVGEGISKSVIFCIKQQDFSHSQVHLSVGETFL